MRIRTLLLTGPLILTVFTVGLGVFIGVTTHRTNIAAEQSAVAERLIRDVLRSNVLAEEFANTHEIRPRDQWYVLHGRLNELLAEDVLDEGSRRAQVAEMRGGVDGLKTAFDALVVQAASPAADPVREAQLVGDLLVRSETLARFAEAFAQAAADERREVREAADRAVLGLLLAFTIPMISVMLYLCARIIGSLRLLLKGAESFGAGELGYRIPADEKNEIGVLAAAMNDMASKLKESRDSLERRVEDRTAELREMSSYMANLLESIGDGVIAIDKEWRITVWNPAATRISGWSREEAIGRPLREIARFIREHDRSENVLFISDAMLSKQVRAMENHTLLIRKDGSEIPVGDSAAPILGHAGNVNGAIIVFRDASSERNAQLIRSSFAYASHQLRTPVTKALWSVEEALEAKRLPQMRDSMRAVQASLFSVRKLVTALDDVSMIDQHMLVPKRERVAVTAIIDTAIEEVAGKAKGYGIRIVRSKEIPAAELDTDTKLLTRALAEVLDNAIEYGKGGDITVGASTRGTELVFSVHDNGIGIPEEQQHIIFTKFFRGQNIPEGSVGAGLGLYIGKEFLALIGGAMWFESTDKKGTTFYISIPTV